MTSDYLLIGELDGQNEDTILDSYTALLSGKMTCSIILYSKEKMNGN